MAFPTIIKPTSTTATGTILGSIVTGVINTEVDDYLVGTSVDDVISGGAPTTGTTMQYVADGVDTMIGGAGDDQYMVNTLVAAVPAQAATTTTPAVLASPVITDTIIEFDGEGVDTVFASVNYTLPAFVENIVASAAGVILTGNVLGNVLDGSQGTINAVDTLKGMEGNDTYIMGTGDKIIEGKLATSTATSYTDTGGIDTISSAVAVNISAAITTNGQKSTGGDAIKGAAFIENVTLTSSIGVAIIGNAKDNRLTGNSGTNTITGGAGNDTLDGGANADPLIGGLGNDTYIVDNTSDTVTEISLGALVSDGVNGTTDLIKSSVTYTLAGTAAGVENLTLTGIIAANATGNDKANILIGNSIDNSLTGGAANDTLTGLQGTDRLDGGTGNDSMAGGRGNDTYIVDSLSDVVTEISLGTVTFDRADGVNGTIDIVQSSVSYSLTGTALGVENLTLTGSAIINATGNVKVNTLIGNGVGNILNGGAGADTMQGVKGNDTYIVDNAGDVVADAATSGGIDNVQSSVDFNLLTRGASNADTNAENLTLTGTAAINGTGNGANNTIIGNANVNTIDGGAGADNMQGGLGSDTYTVDNTSDKVTDTGGAADLINTSVTFNLASAGSGVENITLSTGDNNLTGNSLNNLIIGSSGANIIDGGAGNDTITAGAGLDELTGGTGIDSFVLAALAADADTIADFTTAVDTIDLSAALAEATLTIDTQVGSALDTLSINVASINTAADTDAPVYYILATSSDTDLATSDIEAAIAAGDNATGEAVILLDNGTDTLIYFDAAAQTDAGSGAGLILLGTLSGITGTAALVTGDLLSL